MKKLIILLMFLIFSSLVYGGTLSSIDISSPIWSDDFSYTDNYDVNPDVAGNNWSFVAGCAGTPTTPRNSSWEGNIFKTLSYGINNSCVAGGINALETNIPVNYTNSLVIITYNYSVQRTSAADTPLQITLGSMPSFTTERLIFTHSRNFSTGSGHSFNVVSSTGDNTQNCNLTILPTLPQIPFTAQFVIILNQIDDTYSWYVNGTTDGCEEIPLTDNDIASNFGRFEVRMIASPNDLTEVYFDDLVIGTGAVDATVFSSGICPFPLLFCDNFDYTVPMKTRDWFIHLSGQSLNNSFTPIDNELQLKNQQLITPTHLTDIFQTSYRPDSGVQFTGHFMAPAFSSEFELNFVNQSGNRFRYNANEKQFRPAWSIKAELDENDSGNLLGNASGDMNWFYKNASQPSATWKLLCGNCSQSGTTIKVKINTFFEQREVFPFNSSVDNDTIRLFLNDFNSGEFNNFLSPVNALMHYSFSKLDNGNYTIDNYFVMVGTDKEIYTGNQFYDDIFQNDTASELVFGEEGTGDLAFAVSTIWNDFGLKTQASRIMTGIFLMFFLAVIMFGVSMSEKMHISALTILIIEFFFMIFLTYIRLLPIWIPFAIILIGAGIGAVIFKMSSG